MPVTEPCLSFYTESTLYTQVFLQNESISNRLNYHGGEARDLKLEIPGTPPAVRICISLIFSLIMVGFAWGFFADN